MLAASLPAQTVEAWKTYGDRSKLLQPQTPELVWAAGRAEAAVTITVRDQVRYQRMDGIGASLNESSATVIWKAFDAAGRRALLRELFDPKTGIGLSLLRQPMGASDFSASGDYSYDDVAQGQRDAALRHFSIAHDLPVTAPLVKLALAANPALRVMALPWSPPAWMKTNRSMHGGSIDAANYGHLASYFVRVLAAYRAQDIPIYALSVQNEPGNPKTVEERIDYPSMHLDAAAEAVFIGRFLGPALRGAGFGDVKILGLEHNWDMLDYARTLLANKSAARYLAGTAFHCYGGDESAQDKLHAEYPGKDIWFTECSGSVGSQFGGDLVWNAEHLLIGATRAWARSVVLWNLALDPHSGPHNGGCDRCRGVVTVDASETPARVTRNVEYYALGHLAKFVQPGAVRVDSNSFGRGDVEDVAFRNADGSLVLLVLNAASKPREFAVSWAGRWFRDELPAGALATYRWMGKK